MDFFPNSIPNILEHWTVYKKKTIKFNRLKFSAASKVFQKIEIVVEA